MGNVNRRNISEVSKRGKILRHLNLFSLEEEIGKNWHKKNANKIKIGITRTGDSENREWEQTQLMFCASVKRLRVSRAKNSILITK
jgi:hypothetical protein